MTSVDFSILQRPIETDDDAQAALGVLSWIKTRESAIKARIQAAQDAAVQRGVSESVIDVDGTAHSFAQVRTALEQLLKEYAQAHQGRLFAEKYTAPFAFGEIRYHKQKASVSIAEGVTDKTVLTRLLPHARYVRTKQEIDFTALASDRSKGLIDDKQLAEWGLRFDEGARKVTIHPSK